MSQFNTGKTEISNAPDTEEAPVTALNVERKFGTRKRVVLALLSPVVVVGGICLVLIPLIGSLAALVAITFGLWLPFHAVLGYAEFWHFDERSVTRYRANCFWKSRKVWDYSEVKGVQSKNVGAGKADGSCRVELLTHRNGWIPLPDQASDEAAGALKTLIEIYKRAAMESH